MRLEVDFWQGPDRWREEKGGPSAADVRASMAHCRQAEGIWPDVSLSQEKPWAYITVSGGPELYLVTGEMSDEKILQLTDPGADDEQIPLVVGGQQVSFPRRELVGRDQAVGVALRFLEHGDYDPDLPWGIQE